MSKVQPTPAGYTDAAAKAAAVSDVAYDAGTWDGVTDQAPTKNAVRDKVESLAAGSGQKAYDYLLVNDDATAAEKAGADFVFTGTPATDRAALNIWLATLTNKTIFWKSSPTHYDVDDVEIVAGTNNVCGPEGFIGGGVNNVTLGGSFIGCGSNNLISASVVKVLKALTITKPSVVIVLIFPASTIASVVIVKIF